MLSSKCLWQSVPCSIAFGMNDWMNDCWSFDWGRGTNSDWGDGFRWVQVTSPANSDFLSDFDYLILKLLETMINLVIIPKKYKSRFQGWRRPKITPVATPMVGSVSVLEFLRLPLVFLNRNYGCISLMHPGCWFCVLSVSGRRVACGLSVLSSVYPIPGRAEAFLLMFWMEFQPQVSPHDSLLESHFILLSSIFIKNEVAVVEVVERIKNKKASWFNVGWAYLRDCVAFQVLYFSIKWIWDMLAFLLMLLTLRYFVNSRVFWGNNAWMFACFGFKRNNLPCQRNHFFVVWFIAECHVCRLGRDELDCPLSRVFFKGLVEEIFVRCQYRRSCEMLKYTYLQLEKYSPGYFVDKSVQVHECE